MALKNKPRKCHIVIFIFISFCVRQCLSFISVVNSCDIYISVLGSYFSTIFANPMWFPWKNPFIYEKIQSIYADININNVFVSVRQVFRFFFHICISHFANSKNFIPSVRYTFQFYDIQCPKQIRKVSNYFKNVTIEMQSCSFCEIFTKKDINDIRHTVL